MRGIWVSGFVSRSRSKCAVGYGENHVGVVDDGAFGGDVECG